MAERSEARKEVRKANARQDAPGHVTDLQARPTIRPDSSNLRVEPDALRSLQDHQRVRSDDSHSGAGTLSTA